MEKCCNICANLIYGDLNDYCKKVDIIVDSPEYLHYKCPEDGFYPRKGFEDLFIVTNYDKLVRDMDIYEMARLRVNSLKQSTIRGWRADDEKVYDTKDDAIEAELEWLREESKGIK